MTQTNAYDYIIIGAGSAGCMLAKRLTENPNKKVLLIEAGKNDNYIWIHIPVGYHIALITQERIGVLRQLAKKV